MELKSAKLEAEEALRPLVGKELTTPELNEIENTVNGLIRSWTYHKFFVHDERRNLVKGIKIWYDSFDGSLRIAFRYPSTIINIGNQ